MKKLKAHYEFLPIYGRHIFYGNNLPEIINTVSQYFKKSEINFKELNEMAHEFRDVQGLSFQITSATNENYIEAFGMYIKDSCDINVIAHEALHISNYLSIFMGMSTDGIEDEPQAYLTGYLTEQFMINIRGYKPKNIARKKLKK